MEVGAGASLRGGGNYCATPSPVTRGLGESSRFKGAVGGRDGMMWAVGATPREKKKKWA